MRLKYFEMIVATLLMGGCSARPLPEQVTGFNTQQIVANVRCELRDGLRDYVLGYLDKDIVQANFSRSRELVRRLRNRPQDWAIFRILSKEYGMPPGVSEILNRYDQGAVAYEFMFNGTESNGQSASVDLLQALTAGTISGNLAAGSTFGRNNMRSFNVVDDFEFLTTQIGQEYCGPGSDGGSEPEYREKPNMLYPIVGSLGLYELVGAFLNLNQSGNLVGVTSAPATAAMLPTISENLKFTTTISGGGAFGFSAPAPVAPRVRLVKAGVSSTNSREDVHTLRIVIKLPAEGEARTRTIAEQRLLALGYPVPKPATEKALVKTSALIDLSLAPAKEYLETKILVGQSLGILLPN